MPRLFFDIEDDGQVRRDEDGIELSDLKAARQEAVETLVGLARDILPDEGHSHTFAITVRGEDDRRVFHAVLSYSEAEPGQAT